MVKAFLKCSALACSLAMARPALAQSTQPAAAAGGGEVSGVTTVDPAAARPILVHYRLHSLDGSAFLVVDSNGDYMFSGEVKDRKPDKDLDVSLALKSDAGIVVFHWAGGDKDGAVWSKSGHSDILKTNFQSFAKKVNYDVAVRTPESKEGIAKLYREREKKKEKLREEKKKEELAKEEKKERAEAAAQAAAQRQQAAQANSGGGGTSVGDVIGDIASGVGDVASSLLSLF